MALGAGVLEGTVRCVVGTCGLLRVHNAYM